MYVVLQEASLLDTLLLCIPQSWRDKTTYVSTLVCLILVKEGEAGLRNFGHII